MICGSHVIADLLWDQCLALSWSYCCNGKQEELSQLEQFHVLSTRVYLKSSLVVCLKLEYVSYVLVWVSCADRLV